MLHSPAKGASRPVNALYYGDNLTVLREHVANESVDLVYLDPPFNSNATYNVLFKDPEGRSSDAQIEAFEDTWHWNEQAELAYRDAQERGGADLGNLLKALRDFLGANDMTAYLVMMAVRLVELRRVLKLSGSLYLHCDPTASHYLKLLLDAIFGKENFVSEIVWKRTNARGTSGRWPRVHDLILQYARSDAFRFFPQKVVADEAKLPHTLITGEDGLKRQTYELTAPGATKKGESGRPWRGFSPAKYGRHWANSHAQMDEWDRSGLIHWPKKGGFPRRIDEDVYEPDRRFVTVSDVWTDID
ncbi:MAG: site-specific DNA-methyltransferase, partial [Candidatus Methylomirabilis sp.]|nr:site-specific DNA-methyltransferase [Deltaproteobacteria bacterium]